MSKHRDRQFFIARSVFGLAAAFLVGLVMWIAIRAGGPASADENPVMVQPSAGLRAAESTTLPLVTGPPSAVASPSSSVSVSPSASPSTSPSASAAASATPSKSASPTPSKTSKSASPTPARTSPSPAAPKDLSATYGTSASWADGFIATVKVTNTGTTAHDFTVTLSYPSGAGVSVRGAWNGSASGSGNQITLRGNSLAPGRSITVGFQASKGAKDQVKPSGCTVGGGSCQVS
ncbi:cellulose binding domain-containing protein [Actinoplanes awajinensis]|uniref:CBM2 domain-containing protein n=1 Tax=Actinoplanes awajinensis subsp. mycoplanecinus TaxID=135947 RepID=A0A0X3UW09_9ACTN|nr:cellulose binding domain-containing protein [Actinoplanes awajinensis]KUL36738.1 hypothetical protein ADL15_12985 [Actinoplanes awajinensis subsp. mycoplanecinus]